MTTELLQVLAPPEEISDVAATYVPEEGPEILGMDAERQAISITMLDGDPTIMVGHTGAGKTALLRSMHHASGWPYRSIPGHGRVEVDTLIGKPWVEDGEMTYKLGILPFCMIHGIAVGIQEINAVAPDVLIMLHEYLDEGFVTLQDAPLDFEHFTVRPHANFRLYGTMNPPELYPGTRELSPALLRRCLVRQVGHLDEAIERKVLVNQAGVDEETARQLVKVATDVRQQFDDQQSTFWLSTADLVQWGSKLRHLSPVEAAEVCVVGKTQTDADAAFVQGRVRYSFDPKAERQRSLPGEEI